jgi:mono/diheme cytochrome c family protein
MRTNLTGFALTVGMGLIVIMLGFLGLSAADLVGFSADDVAISAQLAQDSINNQQKAFACQGSGPLSSTAYVPASPKEAAAIAAGEALFKTNCTQCHAVNEKVVGPALAGITKRRSILWIVPWVQNSARIIASGDEYGIKIYNDYGKQQMPSFSLSKKEIEAIVAWINVQPESFPVSVNVAVY